MLFDDKLNKIVLRFQELNDRLINPSILSTQEMSHLFKERAEMMEIVDLIQHYNKLKQDLSNINEMLSDASFETDLREVCISDKIDIENKIQDYIQQIKVLLLPKNVDDDKNAILEVRAGVGGEEAALFALLIFRMYEAYAKLKGWQFEIISISRTGLDGCKEAVANVKGSGVFAQLKYESGIHRVQRVPVTESSGRIHTSAVTVAVLPEVTANDLQINSERDIKIDVFRASGAGGQHVNTTESAVRVTHIPTGLTVKIQDERSQHQNKDKAMKLLYAMIYNNQKTAENQKISNMRKEQVGSGDRSGRIRTYNYHQNRVTDHRINTTVFSIDEVVNRGNLDSFVIPLIADDRLRRLTEISSS